MRLYRLLGLLLGASALLFADPITVTVLNQTIQTVAEVSSQIQTCTDIGTISASCFLPSASAQATITFPLELAVNIGSATGSAASAEASTSATVVITGGNGTGYLNIAFGFSNTNVRAGSSSVIVNGNALASQFGYVDWEVIPFTFGSQFSYSISVGANVEGDFDYSTISLSGAHVYLSQPSACGPADWRVAGLCSDQGFTDISSALGKSHIEETPEPRTILLMLSVSPLLLLHRLRRRWSRPHLVI